MHRGVVNIFSPFWAASAFQTTKTKVKKTVAIKFRGTNLLDTFRGTHTVSKFLKVPNPGEGVGDWRLRGVEKSC